VAVYDEARQRDGKHSSAITEVVKYFREGYPGVPISETEVRRVLANWRPRGSQTILQVERKTLNEEERERRRFMREQIPDLQQESSHKFDKPSDINPKQSPTAYTLRFDARPDYPRFNSETPR